MSNEQYFTIEIQIDNSGNATCSIFKRDSRDAAITNFHSTMASMRASVDAGNLKSATGIVINSRGGIESPYDEYYYASAPEPEPNTEG